MREGSFVILRRGSFPLAAPRRVSVSDPSSMGAEGELRRTLFPLRDSDGRNWPSPPVILGLQPAALVDHVARVDWSLLDRIPGDRGGSQQVLVYPTSLSPPPPPRCARTTTATVFSFPLLLFLAPVAAEDLDHILSEVKAHILPFPNEIPPIIAIAGGSVANTIRGMAAGFGVSSGIIGACGDDEQGRLFINNMSFSGVDLSRLRMKNGSTGQCACLVDADGNRTMRPCLSSAVKLQMVRDYRSHLIDLLESGNIDLCFANEDEAKELIRPLRCSGLISIVAAFVGSLVVYDRKTRGMGAGRKLKTHRRRQRWADKAYKKSHLGNEWKKPFAGSSHAKAKQPNSAIRKCARVQLIKNGKKIAAFDEVLIAGFGRKGHAVGDIPGVRFKVVKVSGVSLLALFKEKKEKPRS
ncbi:hypothetical protein BHM03_00023358 [Ensete ventricosum]|uniref:Carbohydrate kinase PfkB domain-containing protein n=1 Tax=Ensete ventricosum TaxID=4639 RepID=A0A445MGH9_ENSVE|nr:hypothetical protein BHM03_00023358 [Ensete ventricosum]